MKKVVVLITLGILLGLSGCGKAKEPRTNKDAGAVAITEGDKSQGAVAAEYTIKLKDVTFTAIDAGDVAHFTNTKTSESATTETDATGKVLKTDQSKVGEALVYTQTVLEKPDKHKPPTRVRRQYQLAEKKAGDKTTRMGFHGNTVLIEKKGGEWRFGFEGGAELALEDAVVVYRDFHEEGEKSAEDPVKLLLPKKPVKVGETWGVDVGALFKQQTPLFRLGLAKAVGSGKLQRVYKQDGRQFGVVEFTFDIPIVGLGADKADEGSRMSYKVTIDGCIDGSSGTRSITFDANTTVSGSLAEDAKKGKIAVKMREKHQMIRKDVGKK